MSGHHPWPPPSKVEPDDDWDDSPYAGWGLDEIERVDYVPWETVKSELDHESLTYRLSYWFWLGYYRLIRRFRWLGW